MNSTRLLLSCCALALAAVLFCARVLYAQVPTVRAPGKPIQTVQLFQQVPGSTSVDAYTVPAGRRLVITDLVVSVVSNPAVVEVTKGGNSPPFLVLRVTPDATFEHTFATGPNFIPGENVKLINTPASGTAFWYLTGYLTKL
jgi:hypothetical protein